MLQALLEETPSNFKLEGSHEADNSEKSLSSLLDI